MRRFGIGFAGELSVQDMVRYAKYAEELGFESAWMAEDYFLRDAISSATAFALNTEKIKIAIGIINPYTRNPALIAMTIATIDEISRKRAILGLGQGVRFWIEEQMCIKVKKRLTALKETVEIIRKLLSMETVSYDGNVFRIKDVKLGFSPVRKRIPIYIAAVGPRMLQLAGEIGEGVLLTAANSPRYVRYAVRNIEMGAKRAGRDPAEVDIASYIILSTSKDPDVARDASRPLVALALSPSEYGDLMLRKSGLEEDMLKPIRNALQRGDIGAVIEKVTDDMVDTFTVSGTPKECREKLKQYKDAGVKLPIAIPVGDIRMGIQTVQSF